MAQWRPKFTGQGHRWTSSVSAVPKALLFQLAAVLLAAVMGAFVIPVFTRVMVPARIREQSIELVETAESIHPWTTKAMRRRLPEGRLSTSEKMKVDAAIWDDIIKDDDWQQLPGRYGVIEKYTVGWVDLNMQVKTLDPDGLTASIVLTGDPYGMLASRKSPTRLIIRSGSTAYTTNVSITLPGCSGVAPAEPPCADLDVIVGKSLIQRASGQPFGYEPMTIDVQTGQGLDHYPFDSYTIIGQVEASIRAAWPVQRADAEMRMVNPNGTYESFITKTALPLEVDTSKDFDTENMGLPFRLVLVPSVSGWTTESASLAVLGRTSAMLDVTTNQIQTSFNREVLQYEVVYRRSSFTRFFAVLTIILMWIMSLYLVVLAVDHVLFRPRTLDPGTVGYAVGMLFAMPTLRMVLEAPLGSYIDMMGFTWCMLLTAAAVIIMFSGAYTDHDHRAKVFEKVAEPQVVSVDSISDEIVDKLVAAIHNIDPAALLRLRQMGDSTAGKARPDAVVDIMPVMDVNTDDSARPIPYPGAPK